MTISRSCDNCKKPITRAMFVELTAIVYHGNLGENQDSVEQVCGDYCDECLRNGDALTDLLSALKYKVKK